MWRTLRPSAGQAQQWASEWVNTIHPKCYINNCIKDDTKAAARQSPNCSKKPKMKYGEERFKIWQIGSFHPAMWHVVLGSWHWIRRVAAPCNVTYGSGMTCHRICPNAWHFRILLPVLISTISPQSTCYSAPVCEILSKSNCPQQKNDVTSTFKMVVSPTS